jgi:hypothetical protein
MADYTTQFACILDTGSAENAERTMNEIFPAFVESFANREYIEVVSFELTHDPNTAPGRIFIHDDGHGDPAHVIDFVKLCAATIGLGGRWGFTWSHSCSRPRLDGFGGGAHVLDLNTGEDLFAFDCQEWLRHTLENGRPPENA